MSAIPKHSSIQRLPTTNPSVSSQNKFGNPKIAASLHSPFAEFKNPHARTCSSKKPSFSHKPILAQISNSLQNHNLGQKIESFLQYQVSVVKNPLFLTTVAPLLSISLPSLAVETEQISSSKINVEAILVSIDDFFNQNPFFVAGCAFIWLVVIPLTQEYLKKYKSIPAIDAFRKLRDLPNCQLLDIRKDKSVAFMDSPNLKILSKSAVQLEFIEGYEERFVNEVKKFFQEPADTIICVLDNFDGDSLRVAELLYNNGFKEAYAIKGGLRGKEGWQAIQETFLPPSVHVFPKRKQLSKCGVNGQRTENSNRGVDEGDSLNLNGFPKPTVTPNSE